MREQVVGWLAAVFTRLTDMFVVGQNGHARINGSPCIYMDTRAYESHCQLNMQMWAIDPLTDELIDDAFKQCIKHFQGDFKCCVSVMLSSTAPRTFFKLKFFRIFHQYCTGQWRGRKENIWSREMVKNGKGPQSVNQTQVTASTCQCNLPLAN